MVNANTRIQKEREELLTRRGNRRNRDGMSGLNGDDQKLNNYTKESQSLVNSQNMVGEILVTGQAQLNSLVDQRNRMRGIKQSVLKMGHKIGLSNATMEKINKMDSTDAYLVLAGMVVTSVVIYFVWLR